jgi:phage terminase Nu1 subunit (DNA packaging protein)
MLNEEEVTTREIAGLFCVTAKTIADLGKREIIVKGKKRGSWLLQPSVAGYVKHLREEAAARGGEIAQAARTRLAAAQASLSETKAKQLTGELVPAREVEICWRAKLRHFRNRILDIGNRMRALPPQDDVRLMTELRGALTELADERS